MQYVRSHIGKFPELLIRERGNPRGIFHDPRIASEKSAHVRPIFIEIGAGSPRDDRAGHIAPAAGKGLYFSVGIRPVKTRDDRAAFSFQRLFNE